MSEQDDDLAWEQLWDDRLGALEALFGPADDAVGHAPVPLAFGAEAGGAADVVYFSRWREGRLSVTAGLVGPGDQAPNEQGAYELAVCHRDGERWGPGLISRLAAYTLEAVLNPGETMEIGSAVPDGATVVGFLFDDMARFEFRGRAAGVLLCLGITADELARCRAGGTADVLHALRQRGVYPYTDLNRASVVAATD